MKGVLFRRTTKRTVKGSFFEGIEMSGKLTILTTLRLVPERTANPRTFPSPPAPSLLLQNTMATTASELEDYNPFRSYSYDSDVKPSNDFRLYLPPPGTPDPPHLSQVVPQFLRPVIGRILFPRLCCVIVN